MQTLSRSLAPLVLAGLMAGQGGAAAAQAPVLAVPSITQAMAALAEPSQAVKLGDNLWLVPGALGSNVTVLVTDEGLVLVDAKYAEQYEALTKLIREQISPKPIKYVISTHFHAYGSGGTPRFAAAGATVISTVQTRDKIVNKVQPGMPASLTPATVTFEGEMRLVVGGQEVRLVQQRPGHTDTDLVVYFPKQGVICVGDLVTVFPPGQGAGVPPGPIDYNGGASLKGWISVLDAMIAQPGYDKVIGGHGGVGARADVVAYRDQLSGLRDQVSAYLRDGAKDEATFRAHLAKDEHWSDLLIARGAHGLYMELRP